MVASGRRRRSNGTPQGSSGIQTEPSCLLTLVRREWAMKTSTELPIRLFESAQTWEAWLKEHHTTSPGVWLQIAKKGSGIDSVSYAQALDVVLCYGWIDGQKGSLDDKYFLQKFTKRRPKSGWSK